MSLEPAEGQSPPLVVASASGTVERSGDGEALRRDLRARAQGRPLPDHRRRADPPAPAPSRARTTSAACACRRRRTGRARLPARRVPVRGDARGGADDGRRPLLARLRRRRLARPLRGQLLRRRGATSSGRDAAGCRAARSSTTCGGRFEDVSRGSGADLQLRGSGCVAADFNDDGKTDLFVTTAGYNAATNGYDALLWGNGDGTFTEGARAAGINDPGWHSGAAVGDVERRRPPRPVRGRIHRRQRSDPRLRRRVPVERRGRARPPLPERGHRRERPLALPRGRQARRARAEPVDHGLGAVFTDVDGDGRLDLYVANDLDPNRLYLNVAQPGRGLGFRFVERARRRASTTRTPGWASRLADYSLDGREDLFVTNSRRQLHAAYRSAATGFTDARPDFAPALGTDYTGWGVSWVDLDLDTQPRPRARERRDPGREPREGRGADPGAREPDRRGAPRRVRRRGAAVGAPRSRAPTGVASPRPTTTTTATSTSRSTRSGAAAAAPERRRRAATGSR